MTTNTSTSLSALPSTARDACTSRTSITTESRSTPSWEVARSTARPLARQGSLVATTVTSIPHSGSSWIPATVYTWPMWVITGYSVAPMWLAGLALRFTAPAARGAAPTNWAGSPLDWVLTVATTFTSLTWVTAVLRNVHQIVVAAEVAPPLPVASIGRPRGRGFDQQCVRQ
jgi:hypothetical protein